jgi:hypothetical protein
VEQLRGHTAKTQRNLLDPDESIFEIFAQGVSAEMAIRSASAGTSTTQGFSEGASSCQIHRPAGTSFGGGGRLWSGAEPACLEGAASHLNDLRLYSGEGGF